MIVENNFFFKKKILVYGLGKTGISSLNYLEKNNQVKYFDDNNKNLKNITFKKKYFIQRRKIQNFYFDIIIISPGINIKNCKLKNFLKNNQSKIFTDLDVFYSLYRNNLIIAITGTNGKSTTAKLLKDILIKNKNDARLAGNIGNAILSEKKISSKTVFVIEISSYQIEYSKMFKANYGVLLNISTDHLERHKTMKKYINVKLKLIRSLFKNDYAFLDKNNLVIKKYLKKKVNAKIYNVKSRLPKNYFKLLKNNYFKSYNNQQNLSFILKICEKLRIKKKIIFKVVNDFKPLKYRQEIIYETNKIKIINDSKSTSFSSSLNLLDSLNNIYWIIGGLPKKGDKLNLTKEKNILRAYIYGSKRSFFINLIRKRLKYSSFKNLESLIKKISLDLKSEKNKKKINIIFSPCAASFDSFKNFEERGEYFNHLIKTSKITNEY